MKILKSSGGINGKTKGGTVREIGQGVPVRLQKSRPFIDFRRR
jgi:hypothetical protein